jgi:CubicO group peptidase (beta-lactamase class C family)
MTNEGWSPRCVFFSRLWTDCAPGASRSLVRFSAPLAASLLVLATLIHLPVAAAQSDPRFADLDQRIASGQLGPINSLLIQQGDTLLHEAYFRGSHPNHLQDLFSATKSVGATLTGISTLMSGILRAVTSLSPREVFLQWLAEPLGIQHHEWAMLTGLHGPDGFLRTFPFDDVPMGVGLRLRARDLLSIGELYLHRGVYRGQRLLNEEWIDRAWTGYSNGDNTPLFHRERERGAK